MEFRDVVRRRRMVRRFERREIPDDVLKRVLEAARHAPSAGFSQGFDFVVLSKPDELELFYTTCDDPSDPDPFPGRGEDRFPGCIVLPYENKRAYLERYSQPDKIEFGLDKEETWPVPFWTVDTAMAMLLILLAAVDEGLGAWYFGITRGEEELKRKLDVPAESKLLGPIAIGYISPEDRPRASMFAKRRRAFDDMFHFGRW
jgi:nitroreductase